MSRRWRSLFTRPRTDADEAYSPTTPVQPPSTEAIRPPPPPPLASQPVQITVVGNSNSILRYSYSYLLSEKHKYIVHNASIGANASVLLLEFLARGQHLDSDVFIIETSVLDADWHRMGLTTREEARRNLQVFLTEIRQITTARIVLLILPIRGLLFESAPHWIQQQTHELAAMFGVATLDGYEVLRYLMGDWRGSRHGLVRSAHLLLAAAALPAGFATDLIWQSGQCFPSGPLSAAARTAFADDMHVGNIVHIPIAELLDQWIQRTVVHPVQRLFKPHDSLVGTSEFVSGPYKRVARTSSLVSREYWAIDDANPVSFRIDNGFVAVGLPLNRANTCGIVKISNEAGKVLTIEMRFAQFRLPFVAGIYPLNEDLGEGLITISVGSGRQREKLPPPHHWHIDSTREGAQAEFGDLVLLRRDWAERCIGAAADTTNETDCEIVKTDWASDIVATAFGSAVAEGARAAELSSLMAVPQLLERAIATMPETLAYGVEFNQARMMIILGRYDSAINILKKGLASHPQNSHADNLLKALLHFKEVFGA